MIRIAMRAACVAAAIFAVPGASLAGPDTPAPEAPPPIDWRDFVDTDMHGDHVVGEEICATRVTNDSLPNLFVFI